MGKNKELKKRHKELKQERKKLEKNRRIILFASMAIIIVAVLLIVFVVLPNKDDKSPQNPCLVSCEPCRPYINNMQNCHCHQRCGTPGCQCHGSH